MDTPLKSISIIIPCFNEEGLLPICLDHILAQKDELGPNGEIIIALNGSTDTSPLIAESYANAHSIIKVLFLEEPHKKKAMNAALMTAANTRVIFSDADSFLDPTAIKEVKKYYDQGVYAIIGAIRRPILDKTKVNSTFIETYYMMHYAKRLSLEDRLSIQGWFMAIDLTILGVFQFPLDASADDIWLSAHTWSALGASAIGYIPYAIGSYLPPSTIDDMKKQIARHRSNHRVVRNLHPELSTYFSARKQYYNDIHMGERWRDKSIELHINFDSWITQYEDFVKSIESSLNDTDYTGVTWERISSSKLLPKV